MISDRAICKISLLLPTFCRNGNFKCPSTILAEKAHWAGTKQSKLYMSESLDTLRAEEY